MGALAIHDGLDAPSGMPGLAALLAEWFLGCGVAMWVLADARRRHRLVHYDFGTFIAFAWLVVVPIYLFSTRGWRAFAPLGWFLLLYLAAAGCGWIPYFVYTMGG